VTPHPICSTCLQPWTEDHTCAEKKPWGRQKKEPPPPTDAESSLTAYQIADIVLRYQPLISRQYGEVTCAVVPCPDCDADIDQGCVGQYGHRSTTSLHADRRVAAERWRKDNRAEWEALKLEWFRHLVRLRKDGLA